MPQADDDQTGGSEASRVVPSASGEAPGPPPAPQAPATTGESVAAPWQPTSVWSWTARKYRVRATVLLVLNGLLFCGLCVFAHWLHVARLFDFSPASYLYPLKFWGTQTQNLYDFILFPISVDQNPMHGVVIGLLFAAIVAVPITVSIVYGFRSALPFLAAILVFAHLPWMAITLLASCVLASVRPFRMKFRFGSALVAMLPVLLYFYLAARGPSEPLAAGVSPEKKLLLAGPWLLAILAACTMMAIILFIARLVNYRPGAVAPVMAVLFATPVLLFRAHVGVDELYYRVLESQYGPRSERFQPVQDATDTILNLVHRWTYPSVDREPRRATFLTVWSADPTEQYELKRRVFRHMLIELLDHRRAAYDALKDFIADHPTSRYVPCALFIQARVLDMRLDERALGENAQRELYTDFPHPESEPIWTNLLSEYPHSPLAVAARLRVAQLRLRHGDADGALAALGPPPTVAEAALPTSARASDRPLLRMQPPEASLEFDPDQDLFEIRRLRELILANRDDPRYATAPLQALAGLDPHRAGYRRQLLWLAHQYPDSWLYDNLIVRWAAAARDRQERAERLAACIARFPDGDALPEALFARADLELRALGGNDAENRAAGLARLGEIIERFPDTCWAERARERLRLYRIEPVPTTTTRATSP